MPTIIKRLRLATPLEVKGPKEVEERNVIAVLLRPTLILLEHSLTLSLLVVLEVYSGSLFLR